MAHRTEIVAFLDRELATREVTDRYSSNGLQVEGCEQVERVGFAVDACQASFEALQDCQMIVVHHGLFWPAIDSIRGPLKQSLAFLFQSDISLYCSHLPLDKHPRWGNNARLVEELSLTMAEEFPPVGWVGQTVGPTDLESLAGRLEQILQGPVRRLAFGTGPVHRVAVSSGQFSNSMLGDVVRLKVDTVVTGEASHPLFHAARELGLNVLLGGHYATETWGVRALMGPLGENFSVECRFYDHPTGF